jgi:hypothetical protein
MKSYYSNSTWILTIDHSVTPRYKISHAQDRVHTWVDICNLTKFMEDISWSDYTEVTEGEAMLELL